MQSSQKLTLVVAGVFKRWGDGRKFGVDADAELAAQVMEEPVCQEDGTPVS